MSTFRPSMVKWMTKTRENASNSTVEPHESMRGRGEGTGTVAVPTRWRHVAFDIRRKTHVSLRSCMSTTINRHITLESTIFVPRAKSSSISCTQNPNTRQSNILPTPPLPTPCKRLVRTTTETSGILNNGAKVKKNWEKLAHFQCVRKVRYWAANGASGGRDSGCGIVEGGKDGPGVGVGAWEVERRAGGAAGAPLVDLRDMARVRLSRIRHGLACLFLDWIIYAQTLVQRYVSQDRV